MKSRDVITQIRRLNRNLIADEFLRYLAIGIWNTGFGYISFILLTWLFIHVTPSKPALMASFAYITAAFLNITVSFLGYKWFVFRTKGNYLLEYSRSFGVYLPTLILGGLTIGPLTTFLRNLKSVEQFAPYLAGAILSVITVVVSFFGHRHLSFRKGSAADSGADDSPDG